MICSCRIYDYQQCSLHPEHMVTPTGNVFVLIHFHVHWNHVLTILVQIFLTFGVFVFNLLHVVISFKPPFALAVRGTNITPFHLLAENNNLYTCTTHQTAVSERQNSNHFFSGRNKTHLATLNLQNRFPKKCNQFWYFACELILHSKHLLKWSTCMTFVSKDFWHLLLQALTWIILITV